MAQHRAPWQRTWLLRQRWLTCWCKLQNSHLGVGSCCSVKEPRVSCAALAPRGACCNYSSADMSPDIEAGQKKRVRVRPQKANKAAGGSPATTPAGAHANAIPPRYCTIASFWGRADACCAPITRCSLPGKPLAAQVAKTPQATQQPKASQQQASAKKRVRGEPSAAFLVLQQVLVKAFAWHACACHQHGASACACAAPIGQQRLDGLVHAACALPIQRIETATCLLTMHRSLQRLPVPRHQARRASSQARSSSSRRMRMMMRRM